MVSLFSQSFHIRKKKHEKGTWEEHLYDKGCYDRRESSKWQWKCKSPDVDNAIIIRDPPFSSCSWISIQNVQTTVYTDIAILKGDHPSSSSHNSINGAFIFGFSTSFRNWTKSWGLLGEQMAVGNGDKKLPVQFFSGNIEWSFKKRVSLETCDPWDMQSRRGRHFDWCEHSWKWWHELQ